MKVAILDVNEEAGQALASEIGEAAQFIITDVSDAEQVERAVAAAVRTFGPLRVAVSCAGVGWAERVASKYGPAQLQFFDNVIAVNLRGTYNLLRFAAAAMIGNEVDQAGQRGTVVMTASIAAFDGQIGQTAYAASKGAVASMALPAARDLARHAIRVIAIAPGAFDTPLLAGASEEYRRGLASAVPFPNRMGRPEEFGLLAAQIAENPYLNGGVIRLDGAIRMPPQS
jgi:NAD(P)-dependent dehydrogenase (short-subunit alcohol dehydrogenase family)